jgi:hypothetical protein
MQTTGGIPAFCALRWQAFIVICIIALLALLHNTIAEMTFNRNRFGDIIAVNFIIAANIRRILFACIAIRISQDVVSNKAVAYFAFALNTITISPPADNIHAIAELTILRTTKRHIRHRINTDAVTLIRGMRWTVFTTCHRFAVQAFCETLHLWRYARTIHAIITAAFTATFTRTV